MGNEFTVRDITEHVTTSDRVTGYELSDDELRDVKLIRVFTRDSDDFGPIGELVIDVVHHNAE